MKRAGLIDTVYSGISLDEDGEDTETYKKYVDSLVYAYENPDWLDSEREKAKSGINKFYWENIAKEWLNYL